MVNSDFYVQKKPMNKEVMYTGTYLSTVTVTYSSAYTNQRQRDIIRAELGSIGRGESTIADQLTSRLSLAISESTPVNQGLSVQALTTEIKSSHFCGNTQNLVIPLTNFGKQVTAVIPLLNSQLTSLDYPSIMTNLSHIEKGRNSDGQ